MSNDWTGAIDCDVHPRVPDIEALKRHMNDHWREAVEVRGIDAFESISYPKKAPFTARPDYAEARADQAVDRVAHHLLDKHKFGVAILNCIYAVQMIRDENMAAAFAAAINDWQRHEWLDKDARLRASIVVPYQSTEKAVAEVERCASDKRFVQALFIGGTEEPLGKSRYWPIYEACERHGIMIGVHAGSSYHHAVTGSGWPSYWAEDYASASLALHAQVGSLITEGVFVRYPALKAIMIESGVSWLAPYMWRLNKFWRGIRMEVPWIDRLPSEIARDHIRLTTAPFDAPDEPDILARV
ncbi:MAG: amidohydrolase family protein, partial [Hyphomicrobiaceae bacterium]